VILWPFLLSGNTGSDTERFDRAGRSISMSMRLPNAIKLYLSSKKPDDLDTLAKCFTPDATVKDEGRAREGLKDIAAWRRETSEKYQHALEPLAVAKRDGKTIVATKVSGNFP